MILSHKHKFVLIKGSKVAGTSVEIALSQACGPGDIITPITPADERYRLGTAGEPRNYASHLYPKFLRQMLERRYVEAIKGASKCRLASIRHPRARFNNHMTYIKVLELVPEADKYELIFVERSPYAKVMSIANWHKHAAAYNRGDGLEQNPTAIADAVDRIIASGTIRKAINIGRYRDNDGRIRTKPLRMDSLVGDVEAFFRSHGLEPVPLVHAKRGVGSDEIDPSRALRPDQIKLINDMFAEEFETFGWPRLS